MWRPADSVQPKTDTPTARRTPASRPSEQSRDVIVYITRTGEKYHAKGCAHLRKSSIPQRLSEAKQKGYTPCSHCKPPE